MRHGTKEERARWSFLCALLDQLNAAEEDGSELAYAFGEALGRLLELVGYFGDEETDEGDSADESSPLGDGAALAAMDEPDAVGSSSSGAEDPERPRGSQTALEHVPGMVRGMDHVPDRVHSNGGVPRGTGGGAPAAVTQGRPLRRCRSGPQ